MRRIFGLAGITMFLSLTLVLSTYAADESITITTYYPTPQGSFSDLDVSGNLTVGGTVGIGTTNPTSKLVIYDDGEGAQTNFTQDLTSAGIQISTDYTSNAYTPGIFWSTLNNNPTLPKAGIYLQETGSGTSMHFGTSNNYATGITNDAMVIDYAGRVGLGIAGPQAKLHINTYGLGDTDDAFKMGGEGEFIIDATGVTGGRMSILKSGNVGIGTAGPGRPLTVYNSTTPAVQIVNSTTGTTNSDGFQMILSGSTAYLEQQEAASLILRTGTADRMTILSGGNVGIGTTSPGTKLDIRKTTPVDINLERDNGDISSSDVLGTIYFKGYESGDNTHRTGAMIRAMASEGWGDTNGQYDAPTQLQFFAQSNGVSNALTDPVARINDDGIYGCGPNYGLRGQSAIGVEGRNTDWITYGYLGGSNYGVYGNGSTGVYGNGSTGVYGHGDGYGVYGYANGAGEYAFYAEALNTAVKYGPFTGGHDVILSKSCPKKIKPGMILSVTGETRKKYGEKGAIDISTTLPTVQLSAKNNDKAVFGVFMSEGRLDSNKWYFDHAKRGEKLATVNALGEGRVLVTNINGDIEAGDYITTSEISGYGMKQADGLVHNYTLGKATENVDWRSVKETVKYNGKKYKAYLIGVVYTSG